MDTLLRHKLLAYLGGAAITMSSGAVLNRSAELASIPEPIMSDLLMDVHGDGWQPQDLTRLTELLADDPRRQVRRRAAEIFASGRHDFSGDALRLLLAKFAEDEDPVVRDIVAPVIGEWLQRLSGLERACVVCEWASSDNPAVRQTLVEALACGVKALGADLAVEHLANDPEPGVRAAVVETAARRMDENPEMYLGVLSRLTADRNRSIKKSARQVVARMARQA